MKRLIYSIFIISILLSACGGKKTRPSQPQKPAIQVKVLDSSGPQPQWMELGEAIGNYKGQKVIFFSGMGVSKSKIDAKEAAGLNAATSAAAAMKALATKQVARAWESIGIGSKEQKEQVMKGLEAISAKNVNVSGLLVTGVWWRHVLQPKFGQGGKHLGWSQPVYEYYIRYALDFEVYKQRRDAVIEKVKKDNPVVEKKEEKKEEPKVEKKEEEKKVTQEEPEKPVEPKKEEKKKKPIRINTDMRNTMDEYDDED